MLIYVINYGKVLDWMASAKLCAYIVISPILIALFIWIQHHSKNPYVSLAPLFQPKAIIGYFYMMLVMFFSTSTTLLTNYLSIILKSRQHAYLFSLYLFDPGVCNRSFYLFLMVSLAALAFPVSDSGRNELFCYFLWCSLFWHCAEQYV